MASAMKELMDIFYEEAKISDDFERNHVFTLAESLANNCHQKSPQEIHDYLFTAFTVNKDKANLTIAEQDAWDDALMLLELYFG